MYSGVGQPKPLATTAAHIPQQGLVPVPPIVPAYERGTAYRPRAPMLRLPGESTYAARIRNAPRVRREMERERRAAVSGFRGFAQADTNAFQDMVDAAILSVQGVPAAQMAFTQAGAPIDETAQINRLVSAHQTEVAANVAAAVEANRTGSLVPMLDESGGVVMVDPSTDPGVAAAAASSSVARGDAVAVPVGNPLAAAALAVTPAQARAAAEWGQSDPNAQTALLAKAAMAKTAPMAKWGTLALVAAGLFLLMRR